MLEAGATVADFTLKDQSGTEVRWSKLRGKPVVVFAYPKADTPGCTKESCAFRDLSAEFEKRGVQVYGLSADTTASQAKFAKKYDLNMPLLADPDHVILEPWGIWGEKTNYGKTSMGIKRSTFLFDKKGVLVRVWPAVKVDGHAEAVLAAVDEMGS